MRFSGALSMGAIMALIPAILVTTALALSGRLALCARTQEIEHPGMDGWSGMLQSDPEDSRGPPLCHE
jgi:hypothetical protein